MINNSWDIEQNILKLVILGNLCPFTPPPKNLQKSKFWKVKKFPGDIIILHCVPKITIIWCMVPEIWSEADRIFCHSELLFAFYLPPLWIQKIKILKKMKKTSEDIIILQICTINDSHMMYGSWGTECNRQNVWPFWTFSALLPPWQSQKSKFWKNEKTALRSYYFTQV